MADFDPLWSWTVQSPWSFGEDVTLNDVVERVKADPELARPPFVDEALEGNGEDVNAETSSEDAPAEVDAASDVETPVEDAPEPAADVVADAPVADAAPVVEDAPVEAPASE